MMQTTLLAEMRDDIMCVAMLAWRGQTLGLDRACQTFAV